METLSFDLAFIAASIKQLEELTSKLPASSNGSRSGMEPNRGENGKKASHWTATTSVNCCQTDSGNLWSFQQ